MTTATNRSVLILLALILMPVLSTSFILSPVSNLSPHRSIISLPAIDDNNISSCNHLNAPSHQQDTNISRCIIASILAIAPFLSWNFHTSPTSMTLPPMAYALQERNEALCNTGFFTNVGAWYCTDIGNIGDEGKSKPISEEAEASVDSLMNKFNVDGGDFTDDIKGNKNNDMNNNNGNEVKENDAAAKK